MASLAKTQTYLNGNIRVYVGKNLVKKGIRPLVATLEELCECCHDFPASIPYNVLTPNGVDYAIKCCESCYTQKTQFPIVPNNPCENCGESEVVREYNPVFKYLGNRGKQSVCEDCYSFLIAEEAREKQWNDIQGTVDIDETQYDEYPDDISDF